MRQVTCVIDNSVVLVGKDKKTLELEPKKPYTFKSVDEYSNFIGSLRSKLSAGSVHVKYVVEPKKVESKKSEPKKVEPKSEPKKEQPKPESKPEPKKAELTKKPESKEKIKI